MNSGPDDRKGPLDGIRVIDWTVFEFGPVSTMMLADLGAEVIKVESLDGDPGRQFHRISSIDSELPQGLNAYFEGQNRQKLGIALDLKNPKGVEIMYQLVEKSDVFVENFRQGVAERLGLGYDDLVKHNPKIVYGSASGYGPEGPDSHKPAFALTGEARSGALSWAGPDDDTPYAIGIADHIAGIMLSYGVLGAIIARERFGIGQKVDVSHLGAMIWGRGMQNGISLLTNREFRRTDRKEAGNILWNYYRCQDGRWMAFSMGRGDRYWPTFCRAIGMPQLIDDERFNSMDARRDNRRALIELLDEVFITKTSGQWDRILAEGGDLIYGCVQNTLDLVNDPQVIANNYIVDFDHPVLGPTKWLQTPVTYTKTPLSTRKMAPAQGENTEQVLIELLGYTWDDIETLHDEGVIL